VTERTGDASQTPAAHAAQLEPGDIRDLFSYNLQRLAGISTRIALLEIKPAFGLNVHDWRAIAVLDYLRAAPLHVLAQRAGVQKSQMSRTVTALEKSGLVEKSPNPEDGRSSLLVLTEKGKSTVRQVLAASRERNHRMLAYLDDRERVLLAELIEKATRGSLEVLGELRGRGGKEHGTAAAPEPPRAIYETELI
jgi:DNA-binding MarR family transcriptional regulator